jgi:hypothetical protein
MDQLKDLAPFLLAILYFVISALAGRKKANDRRAASGNEEVLSERPPATPKKRPLSFEDLLRDIEGMVDGREEVITEDAYQEARPQERMSPPSGTEKKSKFEAYQGREVKKKAYSRLGDRIKLEENAKKLQVQELEPEVAVKSSFAAEIKNALQTQDGARKAIVFSEILNRKY